MSTPRIAFRLGWRSLRHTIGKDAHGRWRLTPDEATQLARDLGQAMHDFDITTRRRAAMFIAQIAHESSAFQFREERASGRAYDITVNRTLALTLGNTHPGDGPRFKGRTYIQITGRANYAGISRALHVDFVAHPTKLAEPRYAALGAAWWWKTHECNEIADGGDFTALTRRINGGFNGLAEREAYYRRARPVATFLVPKRRKP